MSEKTIHQPADKFFKQSMRDKRVARGFFQQHLPLELKSLINFDTLKINHSSFIDEEFRHYESDLVYEVRTGDRRSGYLYLLLEKQSSIDRMMAFRVYRYSLLLLEHHRQKAGVRKDELPIIYPMVIYSGKAKWTAPQSIVDLFSDPELAKTYWNKYQLIDLQRLNDSTLASNTWAGLMQISLKNQKVIELKSFLEQLFGLLEQVAYDDELDYAKLVMKYVFQGLEAKGREVFIEVADAQRSNRLRGEAMTLAQEFEEYGRQMGLAQGLQLGKQQGLEQGREEGREESRIEVARKLFANGMSLEEIASVVELPSDLLRTKLSRHI